MICPSCSFENSDSARFCQNCGAGLPRPCPNCGNSTPSDARFCSACGFPQSSSTPVAALSMPMPAPGVSGERRVVTILFCDVKGSTASAERFDPEEWAEIMNGAFAPMIRPIYQYEGTVVRLQGDGLMAFFGAPVAHEDDPQRAVLAGLAIVHDIHDYAGLVKQRWGIEFEVRVGINTGLVVVGAMGSEQETEYTAMGDAVNVAARMEQTAVPGSVQIAEETHRWVAARFDFEDLGAIDIRGKREPVRSFRVLGPKQMPTHPRQARRLNTTMVGRSSESALLLGLLQKLAQGEGGIVCLIGEAGLGKSRLLHETKRAWQRFGPPERWYETGSLSYETGIPYAQFQRLLRRGAGIDNRDSQDEVRRKIGIYLDHLAPLERDRAAHLFETMFGLTHPGHQPPEGEAFRKQLFDMMLELCRNWADEAPMALVIDDLHWSDPASVDLLMHLLQLVPHAALLLICAMRPDRDAPGWTLTSEAARHYPDHYHEIVLTPLTSGESEQLVDQFAVDAPMSVRLRTRILQKTEGNPLFLEEVVLSFLAGDENGDDGVRSLYENDSLDDIDIPDSLHTLLQARIDRLPEPARQTLQLASVIGRKFAYRVLRQIAGPAADLDAHLQTLQNQELIRESVQATEREYIFHHALIQDAAYFTILRRQRREYHRRVGQALADLYPGRLEELAPVLAAHFDEANDLAQALHYFALAGDVAFRLYANVEAAAHYARAIEVAGQVQMTSEQWKHLYGRRGRALEVAGQPAEALRNYEEAGELAVRLHDPQLELFALVARSTLHSTPTAEHDPKRARQLSESALGIARSLNDYEAEAEILWNLMLLSKFSGTPQDAIGFGEASLAIARAHDLRRHMAFALNDLAIYGYVDSGEFGRALDCLIEARSLWQAFDDKPMLADNLASESLVRYLSGEFARSLEASVEARRISEEIGNLWGQSYSRWSEGEVLFAQGDVDRAIASMLTCLEQAEEAGFVAAMVGVSISLANLYADMGMLDAALERIEIPVKLSGKRLRGWRIWPYATKVSLLLRHGDIDAAISLHEQMESIEEWKAEKLQYPQHAPTVVLALAEVALVKEDVGAAMRYLGKLLNLFEETGLRPHKSAALQLHSHALRRNGQSDEAYRALLAARDAAAELGARSDLLPVLVDLGEMEMMRGNSAAAIAADEQALAVVDYMVAHTTDAAMRNAFLNSAIVTRLLARRPA
ncbi:MAG: AAA family ATPase [Caldilineales bacterium]|nr:AAA family ATPase [Caldilineales bacterium]